jgi:hypothetical protein
MELVLQARMGSSWWDRRTEETGPQWAERLQALISKELKRKKAAGTPSAQLLLRLPPALLVKLYAIIFSCTEAQAVSQLAWEREKYGFIQMLGQIVVSDKTVEAPEIQELGKLQDIKRKLKDVQSRFGGGLLRKAKD